MYCGQITVKNGRNLPISNPKADFHNINAQTKFGEIPLIFPKVIIQKWNLPVSNLKPGLHNTNAHTKFDENPLTFTKLSSWNENTDIWADNSVKKMTKFAH